MGFDEQRNKKGLNSDQQKLVRQTWNYLGGKEYADLDLSRSNNPNSFTVYNSENGKIYIGANVFPDHGPPSAFSKMSARACIAHELAHAYREKILMIKRSYRLPEALLDERISLIKGAKIRLEQWLNARLY